jgi:hypothetical protein
MSTKVVALQANDGDAAKIFDIQDVLKPLHTIYYKEGGPIPDFPKNVGGSVDYLLFTGGHGNFVNAAPTKMNGLNTDAVKKWANSVTAEFDAIILDTCFSSSFIPVFSPLLKMGGSIVCAHGSGEGFTTGLTDRANIGRSVGEALADIADNAIASFGLEYTSLSLYTRTMGGLRVYTTNAGSQRSNGLAMRNNMGMDADSAQELGELDRFLIGKLIAVEKVDLSGLKVKLTKQLDMVI